MAESRFLCPHCGQNIQCDTSYCGSQINCPSCQQIITVPQAAQIESAPAGKSPDKARHTTLLITVCVVVLLAIVAGAGWLFWQSAHLRDLVATWPAKGNAHDAAGSHNGILTPSGVTFAPGKVGMGFQLDGTNGYVKIPNSPALDPKNVTLAAWVWLDPGAPPGRNEQIFFKKNTWSAFFEGYSLLMLPVADGNGTRSDRFQFCISRNGRQVAINSRTIAQRGVWYQVAATYDGHQSRLYINGAEEASAIPGFALDYGKDPVYIGTTGTWAPYLNMFAGIIDDPSIYNRALSAAQIRKIYNRTR